MDYVLRVGDRQDLPRISGDAARPVENFLVEVRAEEFFFVADDIGKTKHASAHHNPQIGCRKEPDGARPAAAGRPPVVELRNVVARCLVRLIRLTVYKRDLPFLWPDTMHYEHQLRARSH